MANYYNNQIISKFNDALKAAKEEVKAGKVKAASISSGNVKMGAVPSVSTLPFSHLSSKM